MIIETMNSIYFRIILYQFLMAFVDEMESEDKDVRFIQDQQAKIYFTELSETTVHG